jgi:serine protease
MVYSTYDPATDCDGHGTHVSGTIGGATVGVAHLVQLRGVKVLNCQGSGTTQTVALGLQYVLNNRAPNRNVINMSLGYGSYDAVIAALVVDLYNAGVTMVAAAGNDNGNGCTHFPAAHQEVISVASSTSSDQRSSFSNYGSCVELFAPGSSIVSAALAGGTTTMSGTSMASPHVAGTIALLLQNADMTPASATSTLLSRSTLNVIGSANGTPNRLVFSLLDSNPAQPGGTTTTTASSTTASSSTTSTSSFSAALTRSACVWLVAFAAILNLFCICYR